ncbi:MAG: hypothetical protein OER88_10785 [Planctomycetota bacterium]|nr:hypothetical protein [Planctomycetota bacterium]
MRLRQVMDWSAAVWAGLLAGIVFLLAQLFVLPGFEGGNAWARLRYLASPVLGEGILAPPATFDVRALVVAILLHLAIAVGATMVLAVILHRWGMLIGILGGALFGSGLYFINFYTLTLLFPWLFALRGMPQWTLHLAFGAIAGGLYEAFEVEEYEMVDTSGGN